MQRILISIILFLGCIQTTTAALPWHFTPQDVNALHSVPADYRIAYASGPLQFADLRLPKRAGLHPVAIIIHGGCWLSKLADLKNTAALADALRDLGFATWNINYRGVDDDGGGWPGTFDDIALATDYLRNIANEYALDLNHVVLIGHSAGGHLALWDAGRYHIPVTSKLFREHPLAVNGVLVLGGPPDLKVYRSKGIQVCGEDVIGRLLGTKEEQISLHYKETSPIKLLPLDVPQTFLFGELEQAVPIQFAKGYARMAKRYGEHVKLIPIPDAEHHEYIVPNSIAWPALRAAARELIL